MTQNEAALLAGWAAMISVAADVANSPGVDDASRSKLLLHIKLSAITVRDTVIPKDVQ